MTGVKQNKLKFKSDEHLFHSVDSHFMLSAGAWMNHATDIVYWRADYAQDLK